MKINKIYNLLFFSAHSVTYSIMLACTLTEASLRSTEHTVKRYMLVILPFHRNYI